MADKIFKVKKGSRVVIEVAKPRNEASLPRRQPTSQSKGIIKSRREPEYLTRRKKTPKGIRIFDLGRLAAGADISFLFQPDFDFVDFGIGFGFSASSDFPEAFELRDEMLTEMVSGNNFEAAFFEIKQADGDFYTLQWGDGMGDLVMLDTDSDRWRAGGIGLNRNGYNIQTLYIAGEAYEFRNQFFNPILLFYSKVTSVFDYNADPVSFAFGDDDKIFLMPALPTFAAHTLFSTDERFLGNDFRFGLRNYYLADTTPAVDPSDSDASESDPSNYSNAYQAIQYHAGLPNARCYRRVLTGSVTTWSEIEPEEILPDPPFQPTTETVDGFYLIEAKVGRSFPSNGTLLAIVKRGGQLFYIWQNDV